MIATKSAFKAHRLTITFIMVSAVRNLFYLILLYTKTFTTCEKLLISKLPTEIVVYITCCG